MMNATTLRGVFADPKPSYRRNFIRENVKQIKQMQGLLQDAGLIHPHKPMSEDRAPRQRLRSQDRTVVQTTTKQQTQNRTSKPKVDSIRNNKKDKPEPSEPVSKITHRAMQTERTNDDINKLYETGIIKYPSPGILKQIDSERISNVIDGNNDYEGKDFVKENMKISRPKPAGKCAEKVPANVPPSYQRGVVPKYLRDRKEEEDKEEVDVECPKGHVLLPDEERKETLRVLRQSYADRIQELNSMPVRNDTLKMRRRKMEIEEELKKIDGGIKVFQRPKVFVKINA